LSITKRLGKRASSDKLLIANTKNICKRIPCTEGVSVGRISTISLGEERILLHGQDDMAWAQNRRDDFIVE